MHSHWLFCVKFKSDNKFNDVYYDIKLLREYIVDLNWKLKDFPKIMKAGDKVLLGLLLGSIKIVGRAQISGTPQRMRTKSNEESDLYHNIAIRDLRIWTHPMSCIDVFSATEGARWEHELRGRIQDSGMCKISALEYKKVTKARWNQVRLKESRDFAFDQLQRVIEHYINEEIVGVGSEPHNVEPPDPISTYYPVSKISQSLNLQGVQFDSEEAMEEYLYNAWEDIDWTPILGPKAKLKLIGRQYSIGNKWRIDILELEEYSDSLVIIELKNQTASDQVIGQILRYKRWIKENEVTEGQEVKAIVIAPAFDEAITYAAREDNDIHLVLFDVILGIKFGLSNLE